MQDRLLGMVVGHCLGDALGSPFEFGSLRYKILKDPSIYTGILDQPTVHFNQYRGTRTCVLGQVSDDTEMTLALSDSLVSTCGVYNTEKTIHAYMKFATLCPFLGKNTRALFYNIKTTKTYQSRYKTIFTDTDKSTWSQSNGALMRACPLSLFASDENAVKDCTLSNPHPETIRLAKLYHSLLRKALNGRLEAGPSVFPGDSTVFNIAMKEQRGWAHLAFRCCQLSLNESNFENAMKSIICKGGDTDTNAAIAGAVWGAYLGYEKMMENSITKQNWDLVKNCDTEKGSYPRPLEYHPKRWLELIPEFEKIYEP